MSTPLALRLKRQITQTGPISVADYMAACLFDPKDGYYTTKQPFGGSGDFITAPDVSQMFGELIAIWLVSAWRAFGEPTEFALCEIGPGRATLMRDMIRTFGKVAPDFLAQSEIRLIETSPRLVQVQKKALGEDSGRIIWLERAEELPEIPIFMVGNELFDAVPIRQYVKTGDRWVERMVGIDADDQLAFVAGAGTIDADGLPAAASVQDDGAIFEISPAREALATTVADHVAGNGGAALFFDYGHTVSGFGDTLQAVRNHNYEDVLANPGCADLTSHVDFGALSRATDNAQATARITTQGEFLLSMGIVERAGRLGATATETARRQIEADVDRLAGPGGMGELFKVMAIVPSNTNVEPFLAE